MTVIEKKRAFRWFLAAMLAAMLFVGCTTGPVSDLSSVERNGAGTTAISR